MVKAAPEIIPPMANPEPLKGWVVEIPAGAVLLHPNVDPVRVLDRTISVLEPPEQNSCARLVPEETGSGFTTTSCEVVAGHPPGIKPLVTVRII